MCYDFFIYIFFLISHCDSEMSDFFTVNCMYIFVYAWRKLRVHFLLSRVRFRDLQYREYYWSLISSLMKPSHASKSFVSISPAFWANFSLEFEKAAGKLLFQLAHGGFLSLCSWDSRTKLRQQNQTTVSAQSSKLSFRITAASADDAELAYSQSRIGSTPQVLSQCPGLLVPAPTSLQWQTAAVKTRYSRHTLHAPASFLWLCSSLYRQHTVCVMKGRGKVQTKYELLSFFFQEQKDQIRQLSSCKDISAESSV